MLDVRQHIRRSPNIKKMKQVVVGVNNFLIGEPYIDMDTQLLEVFGGLEHLDGIATLVGKDCGPYDECHLHIEQFVVKVLAVALKEI